jgi:hypothetical protein
VLWFLKLFSFLNIIAVIDENRNCFFIIGLISAKYQGKKYIVYADN